MSGTINILVPTIVRTKGCRQGGRLLKSSAQFVSTRKKYATKKVNANSKQCTKCGDVGKN